MKSSEVSTVVFESVNRLFKTLLSIEKVKKTTKSIQRFVKSSIFVNFICFSFWKKHRYLVRNSRYFCHLSWQNCMKKATGQVRENSMKCSMIQRKSSNHILKVSWLWWFLRFSHNTIKNYLKSSTGKIKEKISIWNGKMMNRSLCKLNPRF